MPMEMPKHSDQSKAHFRMLITPHDDAVVKPMFGSLGAFVNGHMYAGLFAEQVGVKLDPNSRAELEALDGTGPFGPTSRPMGGWLALPATISDADATAWIERAYAHVRTMPPKEPKPRSLKKKA